MFLQIMNFYFYESLRTGWQKTKDQSITFWLNLVENWLNISQNSVCKTLRVEEIN